MSATAHYALVPDKHSNHGLPIEPRNGRSTAGDIALLRRAPPCYEMNTSRLLSQFRISAAMRPYVLRVRLRGWDFDFGSNPEAAAAFTARIGEMRRILVARGISVVAADRAILKTMEAAIDFQLAELRYRSLKTIEAQSQDTLNSLIQGLRKLSDAIAQLPPTPKGELNKRVSAILRQATFDSEVFIEIVETITAALAGIAPRRLADNVFSIIHPEPGEGRRPPIIDQWEAMPATTRVTVEDLMQQAKPSTSLVQWLNRTRRSAWSRAPSAQAGRATLDFTGLRLAHSGDLANIGTERRPCL